ncbi:MarR family winged helix-turn-helix transcriptional regulator [Deinococcus budaensis]|uniref:DNA-binding MarR family transcriptional regulator n=1 Tax=Deinococcus budaensis TaxID=1665626 RepID=A0A7W8LPV9_9DEIO|nr:MarR family transcriptional regulator [Deinococcus budaensis]MBB5234109.1 DNA-binding MarR family transcriptional regulator [Deinococcus budaensis]
MTVAYDNKLGQEVQTGPLLRTVTRLFTELQQRNFACCDVQSATQCVILTTLAREGDQKLTALTRSLNLDKAWLSRSTDELVEQGLLVKTPHPGDRRALLLRLTDAGQQAAQELDAQLNAQSARVLARLPEADRAAAVRLLASLSCALQAELNGEEGCGC